MSHAPAPKLPAASEARRLAALSSYDILDTEKESAFEDIVSIAAHVCGTPISVVNLIDGERQWFKAEIGLGVRETPLDTSICAHAILEHDFLVVPDTTQDTRFSANPLVTGDPGLRFYAGALLKTADGFPLGTVCVLDTEPRTLDEYQLDTLRRLARQVMAQLELRRMLRQSERRVDHLARLVATTGHDLKAPLRSALYGLSRLRAAVPSDQQDRLETINVDLLGMDQHLNRLLAASRVDAVDSSTDLQPVALQPVFDTLAAVWLPTAKRKGLTLSIAPTDGSVCANELLLETTFGNLLSNAVKYTPSGGSVQMRAYPSKGNMVVEVEDTGVGIAADKVEELFHAFRQANPHAEGLGLGLWLVRKSTAAMDAEVSVLPAAGGGTTFRVTFATP
jgi:signal transduction histidine kinase